MVLDTPPFAAQYKGNDWRAWDEYVQSHSGATCYHSSAWKRAVERAYGSRSYYLILRGRRAAAAGTSGDEQTIGVLPLFHLRNCLSGNQLVSLPFCDYGGVLADDEECARVLVSAAGQLAERLGNAAVEFRHIDEVACDRLQTFCHKVRMVLEVPADVNRLWGNLHAKVRNQIRKGKKERLFSVLGGGELLEHFYRVLSFNMRDLGSPVHSKALVRCVLEEFGASARLQVVYKDNIPVGAGLIIGFGDTVFIPWASTLRQFNRFCPNMMLYWKFIKYAAESGFQKFDFGRSSPHEGTYNFKKQWGARAIPLHWQYGFFNGSTESASVQVKEGYTRWISMWKRLPLPLANAIGPHIRKRISL